MPDYGMLSLSHSVGYAVRALACMEEGKEGPRFVREIAAQSGVPAAYLAKIFKRLADSGIIETKRGWSGGTRLARPPRDISLHEIVCALDGPDFLDGCLLGQEICSDQRACPTHHFWKHERLRIAETLRQTSLEDVIAFEANSAKAPAASSPDQHRS